MTLNPDGSRNRDNRPYIEEEEQSNSIYLYDPNGPGVRYGLYGGTQPACGSWNAMARAHIQGHGVVPSQIIDRAGRAHLYKHARDYEPVMRHIKQ